MADRVRTGAGGDATEGSPYSGPRLLARVERDIVGLRREAEVLSAVLDAGRHVLLEGPPGTGKSTLLRTVAGVAGLGLIFVEGNAELTPARLVGHHDPSQVLEAGYRPEAFVEGPLLRAMREGGLLYLEELNRVPEETLNVLITALAEGEIHVPRMGMTAAHSGFRLVAAMNPFDAIGTARIGQAISDRMCRIAVPYQDEPAERQIVAKATGRDSPVAPLAVAVGRATREHPDVRMGASVRGAIDLVEVAERLRRLRGETEATRTTLLDAALAALSGRVRLVESTERRPEEVIAEVFDQVWESFRAGPRPGPPAPAPPPPAEPEALALEGRAAQRALHEQSRRTRSRRELRAAHPDFATVSPATGELDEHAFQELRRRDPDSAAALLCELATATDRELRRHARRLAAQVFVQLARSAPRSRRGVRRLVSRAGPGTGDLDLERTLERAGGRPRRPDDLVLRDWRAAPRAACLLIDHSGSMRGRQVALAALAAASMALAADGRADLSVIAFTRLALVLQAQGRRRPAEALVGDVLRLRAGGTTNLETALRAAAAQLARAQPSERTVVLLSDCLATAGGDPLGALGGIDQLHVLGTSPETESVERGRELAGRARGSFFPATTFAQLSAGLSGLLA